MTAGESLSRYELLRRAPDQVRAAPGIFPLADLLATLRVQPTHGQADKLAPGLDRNQQGACLIFRAHRSATACGQLLQSWMICAPIWSRSKSIADANIQR